MCEIKNENVYNQEDTRVKLPCQDPTHNMFLHMYVAPGQVYERICPACGVKITVRGPTIFY